MTKAAVLPLSTDRFPPEIATQPGERQTCSAAFGINGRFLTQQLSGTQRYAREITAALDRLLLTNGESADLFVPAGCSSATNYLALSVHHSRKGSGHVWEQMVLPGISGRPLLNLCNTAPAFRSGDVVCIHDANVFNEPTSYSAAFRTYYKILQPWIANRAMRVATVSRHAMTQVARHLGVPLSAMVVMPNGHEHAHGWDPSRSSLSRELRVERPYVLLLGSRARHKNVARIAGLAEALGSMGLDILIVGAPSSIFKATSAPRATNVRYVARASDDDLAWLFSGALCLAFPSLTEGFGLPVVEAMAWNCPVVSSDRASLPDVCGDAALFADPADDHLWLKHVSDLKASAALRSELQGRGRAQIRKFSWAASARAYHDLMLEPARMRSR